MAVHNTKKQKATCGQSAKEVVAYYLEMIADLEKKGATTKIDWTCVWTKANRTSEVLDTYQRELETALATRQKSVDVSMFEQAAENTAHSHWNEVSLAEYSLGIMPGSFDPIHLGHVGIALASIYQRNFKIDGVIFAIGGNVPDKIEIASFQHRSKIVDLCLHGKVDAWTSFTPLRYEVGRRFGCNPHFSTNPYTKRSMTDIAAFHLLFAMNPKVTWVYITGSDKINKYGTENEQALVEGTLARKHITVLFSERVSEPINYSSIRSKSWLNTLWEKGMFRKLNTFYEGTSSTNVKNMIINRSPLVKEEIDADVLSYIIGHRIDDLYRFNKDIRRGTINRGTSIYNEKMSHFALMNLID